MTNVVVCEKRKRIKLSSSGFFVGLLFVMAFFSYRNYQSLILLPNHHPAEEEEEEHPSSTVSVSTTLEQLLPQGDLPLLPAEQQDTLLHHLQRTGLASESALIWLAHDFVDQPQQALAKVLQDEFGLPALVAHQVRALALSLVRKRQHAKRVVEENNNVSKSETSITTTTAATTNTTISSIHEPPQHFDDNNNDDNDTKDLLPSLVNNSHNNNVSIVYMHVGKTGGLSLDRLLRSNCEWYRQLSAWKQRCFHALPSRPPVLSQMTQRTIHLRPRRDDREALKPKNGDNNNDEKNNTRLLLFTVRHPLERVLSSYDMKHPDNERAHKYDKPPDPKSYTAFWRHLFYRKCFPTARQMAEILSQTTPHHVNITDFKDPSRQSTVDCRELGLQTLQGHGHELVNEHLLFNYQHYIQLAGGRVDDTNGSIHFPPNDRQVLVLRTEHLWNDTMELNSALGGLVGEIGTNITNYRYQHESDRYPVQSTLSSLVVVASQDGNHKDYRCTLCRVLWHELQLYEALIRQSANLRAMDKKETLRRLYRTCGMAEHGDDMLSQPPFDWSAWKDQSSRLC